MALNRFYLTENSIAQRSGLCIFISHQKRDIDLGTNLGAYKGLHLTAYTVKTIAGKEAKTQVGKLKIMDVQGEDISFCKIQSGGKEIKNILDKGETIFVKSTE